MRVSKVRGARSRLGGVLAAAVLLGGLSAGAVPALGQTNNNTSNNTNTSENDNDNSNQNSNVNNNTIVNTITNVNEITNINENTNVVGGVVEIVEVFEPAHVAAAHQTGRLVVTG